VTVSVTGATHTSLDYFGITDTLGLLKRDVTYLLQTITSWSMSWMYEDIISCGL